MRNDCRSYSSINKAAPKLEGKFNVAFGEFPRLSTFTLVCDDGTKYDFGSAGSMTRNRRNGTGDLRTEESLAREAARLIKDGEFVRSAVKTMNDKKYNISAKDIGVFGKNIERHYAIRDGIDSMTSKLMGGN